MAKKEYDKTAIGQRIKQIRLDKGMTTKEFGKLFGATDSNVSSWENGRTSPIYDRLKKIATYGGVSVSYLIHGDLMDYALTLIDNLRDELLKDDNIPDILIDNIVTNVRLRYFYDGAPTDIWEWLDGESKEVLERDFNDYKKKAIIYAKDIDTRDEAIFLEFRHNIDKALGIFENYYYKMSYAKDGDLIVLGVVDGMDENLKDAVAKETYNFLDKLDDIFNQHAIANNQPTLPKRPRFK